MLKFILLFLCATALLVAQKIEQTPIDFGKIRIELTKSYIKEHYKLDVQDISITPKIIFIHYTGIDDFKTSLSHFKSAILLTDRPDIVKAGIVNVSAHFMVERDGTIHQLMPLDFMARHVIGLNYSSIGIENVGGENHKENLTVEQLISNIWLINYLKKEFDSLEYVAAHSEYPCFEKSPLWLEVDKSYRTEKKDPGSKFMKDLRANIKGFKVAPCD